MIRQLQWLALLVLSATLTQCGNRKEFVKPVSVLPPETQVGAGMYACRINGEVWQYRNPTGIFNLQTYTTWRYDPNDKGGVLSIGGVRYDKDNNILDQLNLYADSVGYRMSAFADETKDNLYMNYYNYQKLTKGQCSDYSTRLLVPDTTNTFFRQGKLEITKLDLQARIISGRFACTFYKKGCDTLKITDGRFDLRF